MKLKKLLTLEKIETKEQFDRCEFFFVLLEKRRYANERKNLRVRHSLQELGAMLHRKANKLSKQDLTPDIFSEMRVSKFERTLYEVIKRNGYVNGYYQKLRRIQKESKCLKEQINKLKDLCLVYEAQKIAGQRKISKSHGIYRGFYLI